MVPAGVAADVVDPDAGVVADVVAGAAEAPCALHAAGAAGADSFAAVATVPGAAASGSLRVSPGQAEGVKVRDATVWWAVGNEDDPSATAASIAASTPSAQRTWPRRLAALIACLGAVPDPERRS